MGTHSYLLEVDVCLLVTQMSTAVAYLSMIRTRRPGSGGRRKWPLADPCLAPFSLMTALWTVSSPRRNVLCFLSDFFGQSYTNVNVCICVNKPLLPNLNLILPQFHHKTAQMKTENAENILRLKKLKNIYISDLSTCICKVVYLENKNQHRVMYVTCDENQLSQFYTSRWCGSGGQQSGSSSTSFYTF